MPANPELLSMLAMIAGQLQAQLNGASARKPQYSPYLEAERAKDVDDACTEICRELLSPGGKSKGSGGLPLMSDCIAELVLWRVRDAFRHCRDSGALQAQGKASEAIVADDLLVEGWHSYAEPYWLERMKQFESTRGVRA
jgi:hypothetical protein